MLRLTAPFTLLFAFARAANAGPPVSVQSGAPADHEGALGLTADIRRIVAGEEADGWFSDAEAFHEMDEPVLESVCRATPDARSRALGELQAERARLGDARSLYRRAAQLTDEVEQALTAEREHRALERALARVDTDCPFWVVSEPGFAGLQSDRKRFTFNLETGGNVQLRRMDGQWTYGAGGMGRLLLGWGIDGRTTVLFGPELGGGAMLRPNTSASQFVINYFPALPFVLRRHQLTWHWNVEAAAVARFEADNTRFSFGGRLAGGFGFTALRKRDVLPWVGLTVAYEQYLPSGGRARAHVLGGGLRVGLPWDP